MGPGAPKGQTGLPHVCEHLAGKGEAFRPVSVGVSTGTWAPARTFEQPAALAPLTSLGVTSCLGHWEEAGRQMWPGWEGMPGARPGQARALGCLAWTMCP